MCCQVEREAVLYNRRSQWASWYADAVPPLRSPQARSSQTDCVSSESYSYASLSQSLPLHAMPFRRPP